MLQFKRGAHGRVDRVAAEITTLVVAGWAGRDEAALRHHVEELAALGVPAPSAMPVFYRVSATLLTQTTRLQVLGPDTSGEVEPVIVSLADGLWVGLGSDHTDRKAEAQGIALSKQLCGKVLADHLWRLDDLAPHWDELELRARATIGGETTLYQDGKLAALRDPADLIARWAGGTELPAGSAMFCGTIGAIGGIRPSDRFVMELHDPVLKRTIRHGYDVEVLPVVS